MMFWYTFVYTGAINKLCPIRSSPNPLQENKSFSNFTCKGVYLPSESKIRKTDGSETQKLTAFRFRTANRAISPAFQLTNDVMAILLPIMNSRCDG
ncbi:hypothetical protein CDAR_563781 [Caerostris darwini]|uniref:Uncharacterized protein n=1 Tax=Caerostris darwini TaxID=1538125 RepID=A0AAV4UYB0_9ARAC|nr:hypothetical protein CDAR_563781 [Caerostris darwini]